MTNAHFETIRAHWLDFYTTTRLSLQALDGDVSRALGRYVQDIIDAGPNHPDWPDSGTARFLHGDPDLWHELANSRKK